MATADTTLQIPSNVTVQGDLAVNGNLPTYPRTSLEQDSFGSYPLHATGWRVWDAYQTALGTSSSDDLGIGTGTFATGLPYITSGDVKNSTTTRYARIVFQLPVEYVSGQSVRITANAGMLTTVASSSCTVDFEVYKSARDTTKTGSDLCSTSATTINSLTFAAKDFDITATSLSPGDILDVRMTIACVDVATGTVVQPAVADVQFKLDVKG